MHSCMPERQVSFIVRYIEWHSKYLHLDQHRKRSVTQLLSPAGRQQQLHLSPRSVRQRNLVGALRGQRQLLQTIRVLDSCVVEDAFQTVRLCIVHAGQWKPGTLALEDVVADGCIGRRNGRQWTDEGVEMRAVDVVVPAGP